MNMRQLMVQKKKKRGNAKPSLDKIAKIPKFEKKSRNDKYSESKTNWRDKEGNKERARIFEQNRKIFGL